MGKTIIELLDETVQKYGENPYLYEARNNIEYTALTFSEVKEQSIRFDAGLMAIVSPRLTPCCDIQKILEMYYFISRISWISMISEYSFSH